MKLYEKLQHMAKTLNPELAVEQAAINVQEGYREYLAPDSVQHADVREEVVALVNAGPTARTAEAIEYLNGGVDESGRLLHIVLCNAGYTLLRKGLEKANSFVCGQPHNGPDKFKNAKGVENFGHVDIEYILASVVRPAVFERLKKQNRDIRMFYPLAEGYPDVSEGQIGIGAGSGAPCSALALYAAQGYRDFRFFGMDGSTDYAAELFDEDRMRSLQERLNSEELAVRVDGGVFKVPQEFWCQTMEIVSFLENYPDAVNSIEFSGDTLNALIFNGWKPGVDLRQKFEVFPAVQGAISPPGFDGPQGL